MSKQSLPTKDVLFLRISRPLYTHPSLAWDVFHRSKHECTPFQVPRFQLLVPGYRRFAVLYNHFGRMKGLKTENRGFRLVLNPAPCPCTGLPSNTSTCSCSLECWVFTLLVLAFEGNWANTVAHCVSRLTTIDQPPTW